MQQPTMIFFAKTLLQRLQAPNWFSIGFGLYTHHYYAAPSAGPWACNVAGKRIIFLPAASYYFNHCLFYVKMENQYNPIL